MWQTDVHGCSAKQPKLAVHCQSAFAFAGIFAQTFTTLHSRGIVPEVLYPAVQVPSDAELQAAHAQRQMHVSAELRQFMQAGPLFVSINRFERKKVSQLSVSSTLRNANQAAMVKLHVLQGLPFETMYTFAKTQSRCWLNRLSWVCDKIHKVRAPILPLLQLLARQTTRDKGP